MAARMQTRIDKGYQFLKMDVGINLLRGIEGTLIQDPAVAANPNLMHPFTATQITQKGIEHLTEYARVIREQLGSTIPIAIDHFGHIGLDSCIRSGADRFTFAWYEDMLPWQFPKQMKAIKDAVETPVCTGEDIYFARNSRLCSTKTVSVTCIQIWLLLVEFWKPSASVIWPRSMGCRWSCTRPALPSSRWLTSTVLQQPRTLLPWKCTLLICPGGKI